MGDINPGSAAAAAAQAADTAAAAAKSADAAGTAAAQAADRKPSYTPPESQEDLDRIVEARLARERAKYAGFDELKAKASKYDELEDAKKTDEQRATERIAALESELASTKLAGARARIAAEHHLDPDLLAGSTAEELTAHAEKLAAAIKTAAGAAGATQGAAQKPNWTVPGEGRGSGSTPSGDWIRDAMMRR